MAVTKYVHCIDNVIYRALVLFE